MAKQRLDTLLVERSLCSSRQLAQRWICAGEVMVNQQVIDKPGTVVDVEALISIKARSRFVSRGGEKLAKALEVFAVPVQNRVCLDGGISTGGFTDCLLQAGAKLVYGIDVGYGQVDWRIRNHQQVILRERTNLRLLTKEDLYNTESPLPDLGVVDVSFISLTKILPALWDLLIEPRELILLIKPQFEVGKEKVGKKGVVRNLEDQALAIEQVLAKAINLGWHYQGITFSPITGPAGNIEYLLWLNMAESAPIPSFTELTNTAQKTLKSS